MCLYFKCLNHFISFHFISFHFISFHFISEWIQLCKIWRRRVTAACRIPVHTDRSGRRCIGRRDGTLHELTFLNGRQPITLPTLRAASCKARKGPCMSSRTFCPASALSCHTVHDTRDTTWSTDRSCKACAMSNSLPVSCQHALYIGAEVQTGMSATLPTVQRVSGCMKHRRSCSVVRLAAFNCPNR